MMARHAVLIVLVGVALVAGMGEVSSAYAQGNGNTGKIAEFGKDLTDTGSNFGAKILGLLSLLLIIAAAWVFIKGLREGTENGGWTKFLSSGAMAVVAILLFIFVLNSAGHDATAIMRQVEIK